MSDAGEPRNVNGEGGSSSSHISTNGAATAPKNDDATKAELTNAEKKKLLKAEKAARRAKDKESKGPAVSTTATAQSSTNGAQPVPPSAPQQRKQKPQEQKKPQSGQHRRKDSTVGSASTVQMPLRSKIAETEGKKEKQVAFFAHLYGPPRQRGLEGAPKEVHPAISALALHISSYVICGSHARAVAMLLALKSVIQSYTTPRGNSLPRHLASHFLSPQLSHVKSARPFSTTQSNSIRWLKNLIANIDPSVPEDRAKDDICDAIDAFISEQFTMAQHVIADTASDKVQNGDVILTYGKSAAVLSSLLLAASRGTQFRVVVLDSRPLFEGKNAARELSSAGVEVQYALLTGLGHATRGVTKCFLGAHAVLGNGRVYSRAGTAAVAMMAKSKHANVIVCAESIKFTDRVALDSIVGNELAPEDELLEAGSKDITAFSQWREKDGVCLLNPLYDVTPADYIDIIITELGGLPASSAPAIQRISAGASDMTMNT